MKIFHTLYIHIVLSILYIIFYISLICVNLDFPILWSTHSVKYSFFELILLSIAIIIYNICWLYSHFITLLKKDHDYAILKKFYKFSIYFISILIIFTAVSLGIKNIYWSEMFWWINFLALCIFGCIILVKNSFILYRINKNLLNIPSNTQKQSLTILCVYWIFIATILLFYTRELHIWIPKNYFPEKNINIETQNIDIVEDLEIDSQLREVLVYWNFSTQKIQELQENQNYVQQIQLAYEKYKHLDIQENKLHNYNEVITLNKLKIAYARMEIQKENFSSATQIYKNIFTNNQKILTNDNSLIWVLVYMTCQKLAVESYAQEVDLFNKQQNNNILETIWSINTHEIFRQAIAGEIAVASAYMKSNIEIPLLFDIDEMIQIDKYYKYHLIQNKWELDEKLIISPNVLRKNYFWLFLLSGSNVSYKSTYEKLWDLEQIISHLQK